MAKDKEKKFEYKGREASSVKSRANQSGGSFEAFTSDKIPRYKVKDGDNNLRILPPGWDTESKWGDNWGIELFSHNQIGPDKNNYLCLKKMLGEECPLCDARREIADDDDDDDAKEHADALAPKKRILAYVIDRDDEKAGPMVWSMPWTVEREIASRSIRKKTGELLLIDDPETGYDVAFTREGQGLKTKYIGVEVAREETPLSENAKLQAKWLAFITENALPDILIFRDADYLESAYMAKGKKDNDKKGKGKLSREKRGKSKEDKVKKLSRDDLDDMDEDDLAKVIKKNDLDVDADDFPKVDKLRKAVIEALEEEDLIEAEEDAGDDDKKKGKKGGKDKKPAKIAADDLDDMDEDDLGKLIDKHDLDVDADDFPKIAKLRKAVLEALKEEDLLEDEEDAGEKDEDKGKKGKGAKDKKASKVDPEELDDMDEDDLTKLIKKHELDIEADDFPKVEKLRKAVKAALEEEDLLGEEEDAGGDDDKTEKAKKGLERMKRKNSK